MANKCFAGTMVIRCRRIGKDPSIVDISLIEYDSLLFDYKNKILSDEKTRLPLCH